MMIHDQKEFLLIVENAVFPLETLLTIIKCSFIQKEGVIRRMIARRKEI